MQPRVGVAVLVMRDGKFLMGQRRGSHGEGTWSAPGGWVDYGETYQQAAEREVLEETGMHVTNVRFVGITNNIFTDNPIHSLTVWQTCEWLSGEPTITEPDKFIDQTWATLESLPAPLFLPWEELLKSEFVPEIQKRLTTTKQQ
jgi:ADP-ribose pyrophosphatase YjhB (NUDIX family)